jgi:D-alanine transaminase/branched-chain amino acid aminotransferase
VKAFFNEGFIDEKNACLHISDLSILRGYAVFDFFRTKDSVPLFVEAHIDRFFQSAAMLNLQPGHDKESTRSIVHELIRQNGLAASGIRLLLTGGYSNDGYTPSTANLIVTQQPFEFRQASIFEKGIKLVTFEHHRELPEAKTTGYVTAITLNPFITGKGADDVLYHTNGSVSECRRANFFIVTNDGVLVTPGDGVLKGITRSRVIQLAGGSMDVEVRKISLDEVYNAAEAFVTSTTKRVLPVTAIDGRKISDGRPGRITAMVDEILQENEEAYINHEFGLNHKISSYGPANHQPLR